MRARATLEIQSTRIDLVRGLASALMHVVGGVLLGFILALSALSDLAIMSLLQQRSVALNLIAISGCLLGVFLFFLWIKNEGMPESQQDTEIAQLYAELRQLMSHSAPGMDSEIEQRLARLRALQQEEAAAMRQRYEARSHLKPGTGWQALNQARRLLSENENPPSANPTLPKQA